MLNPQVVVNLLPKLGVGTNEFHKRPLHLELKFRLSFCLHEEMAIGSVKDSSVARNGSHQRLGGIVDERSCRECAPRPSEGLPKGGTQVLAVCVTPGQLDDCVALALQQHGQQSALRKRKGGG